MVSMRYSFGEKIVSLAKGQKPGKGEAVIEIMSGQEWGQSAGSFPHSKALAHIMTDIQYCKAEAFTSCILGTLSVPDRKHLDGPRHSFAFYIRKEHLIFIDDSGLAHKIVSRMQEMLFAPGDSISDFFVAFLEALIQDDSLYLQKYEQKLAAIEEQLMTEIPDHFYETIIRCRKELLVLHTYYEQLMDVGGVMENRSCTVFADPDCTFYTIFSDRAGRLHHHVEMLREYVLQIREMYQSQLNIMQNRTMNLLTVVTTIFLPLTLLAGWYGMNFTHMPELTWKYGYVGVVILSLVILGVEIYIFKKKRIL